MTDSVCCLNVVPDVYEKWARTLQEGIMRYHKFMFSYCQSDGVWQKWQTYKPGCVCVCEYPCIKWKKKK